MISIAMDCRKISDGGIGTYIRNLLRCWKRQKVEADFYLFAHSGDISRFEEFRDFANIIFHDYPKYSIRELFSFSKPLKKMKIDLFFCPHYTLPFRLPCPSVVTIHDLIHLRMPVKAGVIGRAYAKYILGNACKNSRTVLTISEYSKSDISDLFPEYSSKVTSIYIGVDKSIFKPLPHEAISSFRMEKGLESNFALYVGALKNHKNPGAMIAAANKLKLPLVILTNDIEDFNSKILPNIHDRELIRLYKSVNEEEIALIYNSATLLFHPSLYEGFGLPPLEAMACGLPVVCSNKTSIPEVVGDAGITFSPDNIDEMLVQLKKAWDSPELRKELSSKGLKRSDKFDWDDTAAMTFEILKSAVRK